MTQAGRLDPLSRAMAGWFLVRLAFVALLALLPCLVTERPLRDGIGLAVFACALGGTVSMLFAVLKREPMGQGSLNGWDESLAFIAASRLFHAALIMQG